MIKILPLLIIPIFFLIVYSGVKNLTQNKLDDVVKVTEIQESLNDNLDSDLSLKTEAIKRKKEERLEDTKAEKKTTPIEKDSAITTIQNNKEENKEEKKENKIPSREKDDSKMTALKKNKSEEFENSKKVFIQFGAFSRKDYAENSKSEIEKKIKEKFKEVNLNIDFLKDKKLYKLVYLANSESAAKSICDFSKKIKINCLIRK
jgi:hypothetical protein|tara:strand:- start:1009 stop:1620 length:612 start_codon:yes stop_codon:yes gene_type:complete